MKQMENFRKAHALVTVFRTSKIRPAVLKVCIWRKDCNFIQQVMSMRDY